MSCTRSKTMGKKIEHRSMLAYWTITLIHDNPLLKLLKDPFSKLRAAGLKEGQKVIEVGCGPGFYTIPAAKIVGRTGQIYAMDLHPGFIERVEKKAEKAKLSNITAIEGNASETAFPEKSMDLAFLFGLGHISGGLEDLILEMKRIIRPAGTVAFEKGHGKSENTLNLFNRMGFSFSEQRGRLMIFERQK